MTYRGGFSHRQPPVKERHGEREIYGIFAESDSDGSEEGVYVGFKNESGKRRGRGHKKDDGVNLEKNAPSFVRGSVLNPSNTQHDTGKERVKGGIVSQQDNGDEESEDISTVSEGDLIDRILEDDQLDYSNDEGYRLYNNDETSLIKATREMKKLTTKIRTRGRKDDNRGTAYNPDMGIHPTQMSKMYGAGLQMMRKMGYKGGGLGRDGTGVVVPIEAKARKQLQGLQNEEEMGHNNRKLVKQIHGESDSPKEIKVKFSTRWSKKPSAALKIGEEALNSNALASELDDLIVELEEKLSWYQRLAEENFAQMQREMKYQVDVEGDISALENKLKSKEQLLSDSEVVSSIITEACTSFEKALGLSQKTGDQSSLYQELQHLFSVLEKEHQSHENVYLSLELDQLASSYSRRCLDQVFLNWRVEEDCCRGYNVMSLCKNFFRGRIDQCDMSHHLRSVLEAPLLSFFLDRWEMDDTDTGMKCYETWKSVISPLGKTGITLMDKIKEVIVSRLLDYVNASAKSEVSHIIVHPWLSIFGEEEMSRLISTFTRTAKSMLSNGAMVNMKGCQRVLDAWKPLLDQEALEAIKSHLCNLMILALKDVEINPRNQDTRVIESLMPWCDYIGPDKFASVFCKEFMPRWLKLLTNWLSLPSANFEEVIIWYNGWKSIFPNVLLRGSELESFFRRALNEMDRVSRDILNMEQEDGNSVFDNEQEPRSSTMLQKVTEIGADHGITLLKRHGLEYEGMQVYAFGPASIAFEGGTMLILKNGSATTISVEELMNLVT